MNEIQKSIRILQEDGLRSLYDEIIEFSQWKVMRTIINSMPSRLYDYSVKFDNHKNDKICYSKTEKVSINSTSCPQDLPEQVSNFCGEYKIDNKYLVNINNTFLTSSSIVLTTEGDIVPEVVGHSEWFRDRVINTSSPKVMLLIISPKPEWVEKFQSASFEEISIGFHLVRHGSYHHWMTECLPTIRGLEYYEEKTGKKIPIILEPDPPSWVLEYLDILGHRSKVHPLNGEIAKIHSLITPYRQVRRYKTFIPSTENLQWVKNRFLDELNISNVNTKNRIYISRDDTNDRQITNEKELMSELSKLGFERYLLSDLNLVDQIRLFANAECVVGAHGAGLANTIFSKDISIFEIIPGSFYWHDFYCLANQLGFKYDYHRVEDLGRDADMKVNVNQIRNSIEKLL